MRVNEDTATLSGVLAGMGCYLLIHIALIAALAYVAVHFIRKVW